MRVPRHFTLVPRLAIAASLSLLCFPAGDGSAGTYRNSAHGGSNDVPTTGQGVLRPSIPNAAGNCAHCHEQHASLGGAGPADYLLFDTVAGNAICYPCHDATPSNNADNIESQFSPSKTYQHDPASASGLVLCIDCHDSHVAQKTNHDDPVLTPSNVVGPNSPLLSVKGTSVSGWTGGSPAVGNENLGTLNLNPLAEPISYEYELCFRCHAVQPPLAANLDVGLQFNPNNYAVHPVATEGNPWKNTYLRITNPGALNSPWAANVDAKMYCSDCHGSETPADPKGPHGSTIKYMLKAGPGPTLLDNLCLKCHKDPGAAGYVNSSWIDNWGSGLIGDHTLPAHQSTITNGAGTNNTYGCLACHGGVASLKASSVHGANYVGNNGGGTGRPSYAFLVSDLTNNYFTGGSPFTPGNRFCSTVTGSGCHAADAAYAY